MTRCHAAFALFALIQKACYTEKQLVFAVAIVSYGEIAHSKADRLPRAYLSINPLNPSFKKILAYAPILESKLHVKRVNLSQTVC